MLNVGRCGHLAPMSLSDCAIEYLLRIRLTRCRRSSPFLSSSGTVVGISPVGVHVLDDLTKLQGQAAYLSMANAPSGWWYFRK